MDEKFISYFSGFFDGEGNLLVRIKKDPRYKLNVTVKLRIQIQQKTKEVLEYIQNHTNSGHINYHEYRDIWEWAVYDKIGLRVVCTILENQLIVKKKKLAKFIKILSLYENKLHLSKEGLNQIRKIWDK